VSATVTCDAPWAWENPKTINLTSGVTTTFYNESEDEELMKPILKFTTASSSSYVIIEVYNEDYSFDRTTTICALAGKTLSYTQQNGTTVSYTTPDYSKSWLSIENVTLDNGSGIFTSTNSSGEVVTGLRRIQGFNKVFLFIPKGKSYIKFTASAVTNAKIIY